MMTQVKDEACLLSEWTSSYKTSSSSLFLNQHLDAILNGTLPQTELALFFSLLLPEKPKEHDDEEKPTVHGKPKEHVHEKPKEDEKPYVYSSCDEIKMKITDLLSKVPRIRCGYEFRRGDIAWNCKSCQKDETCVLCNDCYMKSNHDGHEVFFYYTQSGGCCDCGDQEAWEQKGFCTEHTVIRIYIIFRYWRERKGDCQVSGASGLLVGQVGGDSGC